MWGFNVRSPVWCSDGSNIVEGIKLSLLISCSEFKWNINEPTHIQRQRFSFIDLIFTDQRDLSITVKPLYNGHAI